MINLTQNFVDHYKSAMHTLGNTDPYLNLSIRCKLKEIKNYIQDGNDVKAIPSLIPGTIDKEKYWQTNVSNLKTQGMKGLGGPDLTCSPYFVHPDGLP